MSRLPRSLAAWGSPRFASTLKSELEALPPGSLPLDEASTQGGRVAGERITVSVLHAVDAGEAIRARVGVLFTEVVGGCTCGDDTLSVLARCTLQVEIAKADAALHCVLLPEC